MEVDKHELLSGLSDREHTSGCGNGHLLEELTVLGDLFVEFAVELVNSVGALEFVGIGVLALVANTLHVGLAVCCVLGGVELLNWACAALACWDWLVFLLFFLFLEFPFLFSQLLAGLQFTKQFDQRPYLSREYSSPQK